jgi:hypothetical protein
MIAVLMSKGLKALTNIMRLSSPEDKVLQIERMLGAGYTGFGIRQKYSITNALNMHFYFMAPNNLVDLQRIAAVFNDDHDTLGPNAAWPWSLKHVSNQPSPWYTYFWKKEYLVSWGYVMWDQRRLTDLHILEQEAHTLQEHGPKSRYGLLLSDRRGTDRQRLIIRLRPTQQMDLPSD